MSRRWVTGAGVVLVAAAVSTIAVLVNEPAGLPELVFGTAVFTLLISLGRAIWGAGRAARRQRREAAVVLARRPDEVADAAVEAERARLSDDIDACVRSALEAIADLTRKAQSADDPRALLRDIQGVARRAGTELRRQLGLLHEDQAPLAQPPLLPGPSDVHHLARSDVWVAVSVTALAVVEAVTWTALEGLPASWVTVLLTGLAAGSVLTRRLAPKRTALTLSAVLLLGAVTGLHVHDGIWMIVATGLVAWPLAAGPEGWRTWSCLVVLAAAVILSRWSYIPDNIAVNVVGLVVATAAAWLVGRSNRSRRHHESTSDRHQRLLRQAAQTAVRAERAVVARELHDLGSHAVAVVAVQAAAAEMAWERDPSAATKALQVVRATTAEVLTELQRLRPGFATVDRDWEDVERLVERMRSTGIDLRFDLQGAPPRTCVDTVHRIVQESLTNALRHAPGASVTVLVVHTNGHVDVEVRDQGGQARPASSGRGYGLVGLHDRVSEVGGMLIAGSDGDGGFRVRATLPYPAPLDAR